VFSTGQRFDNGELLVQWRHNVQRQARLDLAVGGALVDAQFVPWGPTTISPYPELNLSWIHTLIGHQYDWEYRLGAQLLPFLDRITAQLYERLQLSGSVAWRLRPHLELKAEVFAAFAVPKEGPSPDELLSLSAGATYAVDHNLAFEGGVRAFWDRIPYYGATQLEPLWVVYVAVALGDSGGTGNKPQPPTASKLGRETEEKRDGTQPEEHR
jgi:hypothetical protein